MKTIRLTSTASSAMFILAVGSTQAASLRGQGRDLQFAETQSALSASSLSAYTPHQYAASAYGSDFAAGDSSWASSPTAISATDAGFYGTTGVYTTEDGVVPEYISIVGGSFDGALMRCAYDGAAPDSAVWAQGYSVLSGDYRSDGVMSAALAAPFEWIQAGDGSLLHCTTTSLLAGPLSNPDMLRSQAVGHTQGAIQSNINLLNGMIQQLRQTIDLTEERAKMTRSAHEQAESAMDAAKVNIQNQRASLAQRAAQNENSLEAQLAQYNKEIARLQKEAASSYDEEQAHELTAEASNARNRAALDTQQGLRAELDRVNENLANEESRLKAAEDELSAFESSP